jgi:hypothetical protein
MARYIARVELKGNPSRETYDKLHALMSNLGFKQTIAGTDDEIRVPVVADLPHATYAGLSNLSTVEVSSFLAERIKHSVNGVGRASGLEAFRGTRTQYFGP